MAAHVGRVVEFAFDNGFGGWMAGDGLAMRHNIDLVPHTAAWNNLPELGRITSPFEQRAHKSLEWIAVRSQFHERVFEGESCGRARAQFAQFGECELQTPDSEDELWETEQ